MCFAFASSAFADDLKLAVTTSFENSGLAEILLPAIKQDLDIDVQLIAAGTGQALRLGEAGDVDTILVHAKAAEEEFVAAGFATHRRQIMYNDFVLIGPKTDPGTVHSATTAEQAFSLIASTHPVFVSRGDESGTHKADFFLWASAGLVPTRFGDCCNAVAAGMSAALNTAGGLDAYILSDRASWLNFRNQSGLTLLFAGDPALFNQYSFLPVNPAPHAHIRDNLAKKLESWLSSARY